MNITIFGTGMVARSVGEALARHGASVTFGTRDVDATHVREDGNGVPFGQWLSALEGARLTTFAEAASVGEILINATSGSGSIPALESVPASALDGKILIDIANPLDFSQGFPPSLTVCNTDSLGERIQSAFPGLQVVKTLNTLTAPLMVNPSALPGDHVIFVSGNAAEAKATVIALLGSWFGWSERNIIDLGDITTARGTEMILPLWVRLYGALGSPMFNFNIVRGTLS